MIWGRFWITIIVLICTTPCFVRAQIPKPDDISEDAWKEILKHAPDAGKDMSAPQVFKYPLHNASPAGVAKVINLIFIGEGGGRPPPTPATSNPAATVRTIPNEILQKAAGLVGQVFVVADEANNSVLIATTPQNWINVKPLIDELDRPLQQFMIKALFTEVTRDDSPQVRSFIAALAVRQTDTFPKLSPMREQTNWSVTKVTPELAKAFQQMVDSGKAEVISRPYVLGTDNAVSTISVALNEQGRDPSFPEDESCLIDVIPRSNPGMMILDFLMHLHRPSDPAPSIPISTGLVLNTGSGAVRIALEQGQSVILHGFIHQHETTTIAKIPVVGDLPLLGALFTGKKTTKTNVELVVIITATPAKPGSR